MTKHRHAEIAKAKLDNIELVVFTNGGGEWRNLGCMPRWGDDNYFLCLPQHKEVCLHWLNGGKYQVNQLPPEDMITIEETIKRDGWVKDHWFMSEVFTYRIKPKREKRYIGVHNSGLTTDACLSRKGAKNHPIITSSNINDWQIVEIEVEV